MSSSSETVIREVCANVWTFSRPFSLFRVVPVGGRTTAIKLSTGEIWVLASTPLDDDTKKIIDSLGPVRWIVSASAAHHFYLAEYKTAYPDAQVIGGDGIREKKQKEGLKLDGVYGFDPDETLYGFEDEIKACYCGAHRNKEVAFFHVASKTLLVQDLLFNLPATEQYSKSKSSSRFPLFNRLYPGTMVHRSLTSGLVLDPEEMGKHAKIVLEWGIERIIMAHGEIIENNAKEAWRRVFGRYI